MGLFAGHIASARGSPSISSQTGLELCLPEGFPSGNEATAHQPTCTPAHGPRPGIPPASGQAQREQDFRWLLPCSPDPISEPCWLLKLAAGDPLNPHTSHLHFLRNHISFFYQVFKPRAPSLSTPPDKPTGSFSICRHVI